MPQGPVCAGLPTYTRQALTQLDEIQRPQDGQSELCSWFWFLQPAGLVSSPVRILVALLLATLNVLLCSLPLSPSSY